VYDETQGCGGVTQSQCQTFSMDVDERKEASLIHDDTRCQDIGELFIMSFVNVESSMSIVHFCILVCFVCL
jgi:hypothetical protein